MKKIISIMLAASLVFSAAGLSACGGGEAVEEETSELIGKFTSSGSLDVTMTSDVSLLSQEYTDGATNYIYTSSVYPLNTVEGEGVVYYYSQTLRLKRDFTYEYTYSIGIRKETQSGDTELAKIEISSMAGTFVFEQISDVGYMVQLSDPVSGTENFYGAYIVGEANVYGWTIGSSPAYSADLSLIAANSESSFDRYTAGRTVTVLKNEDRELYDDIYYSDILSDVAKYYSYDASDADDGDETEDPVTPSEPDETQTEVVAANLPVAQDGEITYWLSVNDELALNFKVNSEVSGVMVNGQQLEAGDTENNETCYSYAIGYADLANSYTVKADGSQITVEPCQYLKDIVDGTPSVTGNSEELSSLAAQRLAVSILNVGKSAGAAVDFSDDYTALVFDSLGTYYHSDWGQRDYFTISDGGLAVEGFAWGNPETTTLNTANSAALYITFTLSQGEYNDLSAAYTIDGVTYTVDVEDGGEVYGLTTGAISPLAYNDDITIVIYNGGEQISSSLTYSINRAIAKADLSSDEDVTSLSKAYYSLGKSAAWVLNAENMVCIRQPSANNGTGYYNLTLSNYTYYIAFTGEAVSKSDSSSALYIGGTIVSDYSAEYAGSAFTATKTDDDYQITVSGGNIDGIYPSNTNDITSVKIVLNGDATLEEVLIPMFGVNGSNASIYLQCAVEILSENNCVLTVKGNIIVGDLVIDGAVVNVDCGINSTGVVCGSLTVKNGGALNVNYCADGSTSNSGMVIKGDVEINGGVLSCSGYYNGIYLDGDDVQNFTVEGTSTLYITAQSYGITGSAPTFESVAVNRNFVFNGGSSYIRAGTGINYADISVGDANLTIIADSGYTIESEDSSRPVTFATTSGDSSLGNVVLVNNYYNAYWDVNYTIKVQTMDLNGGNVYIYGMCKNGVVFTRAGSVINVKNCDLTVENGQDLTSSYGRAFNLENGGEVLTVENSAILVVKNIDAFAACWSKSDENADYAKLINNGLIIMDGYKCSLESWELTSWSNNLTVENSGQIRLTNYLG